MAKSDERDFGLTHCWTDSIQLSGVPGHSIYESLEEVFQWFYAGEGSKFRKVTIKLNDLKVTMER